MINGREVKFISNSLNLISRQWRTSLFNGQEINVQIPIQNKARCFVCFVLITVLFFLFHSLNKNSKHHCRSARLVFCLKKEKEATTDAGFPSKTLFADKSQTSLPVRPENISSSTLCSVSTKLN